MGARARRWILRHESRPYGAQQARKLYNASNRDKETLSACQCRLFWCLTHTRRKGGARPVPAAAVIPAARVIATFTGLKAFVAWSLSLWGNLLAQPKGVSGKLAILEPGEVRRTSGVGVKSCNPRGTTDGEGILPERLRQ